MPFTPPNITGYRLEEVEVPAPKPEQQIINEVLGITPPTPPPGPPRRILKIIIEGDEFPMSELPFSITIGDQTLRGLSVTNGGKQATAYIEQTPQQGEQIALHFPFIPTEEEGRTLLAGVFDIGRLDTGVA
jgi:hypothetical protein